MGSRIFLSLSYTFLSENQESLIWSDTLLLWSTRCLWLIFAYATLLKFGCWHFLNMEPWCSHQAGPISATAVMVSIPVVALIVTCTMSWVNRNVVFTTVLLICVWICLKDENVDVEKDTSKPEKGKKPHQKKQKPQNKKREKRQKGAKPERKYAVLEVVTIHYRKASSGNSQLGKKMCGQCQHQSNIYHSSVYWLM